jgi:hypothetical protein
MRSQPASPSCDLSACRSCAIWILNLTADLRPFRIKESVKFDIDWAAPAVTLRPITSTCTHTTPDLLSSLRVTLISRYTSTDTTLNFEIIESRGRLQLWYQHDAKRTLHCNHHGDDRGRWQPRGVAGAPPSPSTGINAEKRNAEVLLWAHGMRIPEI